MSIFIFWWDLSNENLSGWGLLGSQVDGSSLSHGSQFWWDHQMKICQGEDFSGVRFDGSSLSPGRRAEDGMRWDGYIGLPTQNCSQ